MCATSLIGRTLRHSSPSQEYLGTILAVDFDAGLGFKALVNWYQTTPTYPGVIVPRMEVIILGGWGAAQALLGDAPTGHVYADYLAENGEQRAAEMLRKAFPLEK